MVVKRLIVKDRSVRKTLPLLHRNIVVKSFAGHPLAVVYIVILGGVIYMYPWLLINKGLIETVCKAVAPDLVGVEAVLLINKII